MAVAVCITLTIGTYHFICSTWVLDWTEKSLIEYDPSMSNKNLCCTLLKRLYWTISEQVVHGGVGTMGSFFEGLGIWLEVWRQCVLKITTDDVIPYVTKSSVVHLFATVFSPFSTHHQFLFPLFDITASILFTIGGTTITRLASVAMISCLSLYLVIY